MRVSLQAELASKWNGPRESTAMEGGTLVFTGGFQANQFGGPQGHTPRLTLAPGRDYLLEYRLRFDTGYDFSRGGKIPGLAGGTAPTGCVQTDGSGFSARMMWRQNGKLIGYIYDLDQRVPCGEGIDTPVNFNPGQWYSIKERVRINTARNHDGLLQIWVDDKLVIDQKNRAYMIEGPNRLINQVLFHSFFGGSTQDWAPSRNCTISFSDPYATRLPD
jgi:hypothetical protein